MNQKSTNCMMHVGKKYFVRTKIIFPSVSKNISKRFGISEVTVSESVNWVLRAVLQVVCNWNSRFIRLEIGGFKIRKKIKPNFCV
jgi:hypothetical protein